MFSDSNANNSIPTTIKYFLLIALFQATLSLVLQDSSSTTPTQSPITKAKIIEYYNDSVISINTTYNATMDLLANKTGTLKQNVSDIVFGPTSEIDYYISFHQWRIDYVVAKAQNQGTYRDRCMSFESKIMNISNDLEPEIVTCIYDVSNKSQAYYDNKNFSIPFELTKFESGIYYDILDCNDTDTSCLNDVLGYINNCKGLVMSDLEIHQSDINKRAQETEEALNKCQMLEEAVVKYDIYLDEMSECLGVTLS